MAFQNSYVEALTSQCDYMWRQESGWNACIPDPFALHKLMIGFTCVTCASLQPCYNTGILPVWHGVKKKKKSGSEVQRGSVSESLVVVLSGPHLNNWYLQRLKLWLPETQLLFLRVDYRLSTLQVRWQLHMHTELLIQFDSPLLKLSRLEDRTQPHSLCYQQSLLRGHLFQSQGLMTPKYRLRSPGNPDTKTQTDWISNLACPKWS